MKKYWFLIIFVLIGLADASYLTYEHYSNIIPPCSTNILFLDCGKVLQSAYAQIAGIPLALLGALHYGVLLVLFLVALKKAGFFETLIRLQIGVGFLVSLGLIYLQIGIIHAICFYCMISAINSILMFIFSLFLFKKVQDTPTVD